MPTLGGLILRYREGIDAMARAPLKLQLRKNQLHKDLGKAPGAKITEADITKGKIAGWRLHPTRTVRRECEELETPR
jgi:hypothetical protein